MPTLNQLYICASASGAKSPLLEVLHTCTTVRSVALRPYDLRRLQRTRCALLHVIPCCTETDARHFYDTLQVSYLLQGPKAQTAALHFPIYPRCVDLNQLGTSIRASAFTATLIIIKWASSHKAALVRKELYDSNPGLSGARDADSLPVVGVHDICESSVAPCAGVSLIELVGSAAAQSHGPQAHKRISCRSCLYVIRSGSRMEIDALLRVRHASVRHHQTLAFPVDIPCNLVTTTTMPQENYPFRRSLVVRPHPSKFCRSKNRMKPS